MDLQTIKVIGKLSDEEKGALIAAGKIVAAVAKAFAEGKITEIDEESQAILNKINGYIAQIGGNN